MLQVIVTLTFDLLTLKLKGINYGSGASMIPRTVYLGEIQVSLKLMNGQDFANAGRTDGRTDRRRAPKHNTTEGPIEHKQMRFFQSGDIINTKFTCLFVLQCMWSTSSRPIWY